MARLLERVTAVEIDPESGEVLRDLPTFVYRMTCGHLVQVISTPLPRGTLDLYCEKCQAHRDLVDQLL